MPTIAVLDYGIGNLRSAQKALERAGADAILTAETEAVKKADGVVLPGVGNFGTCIEALRTTGVDQMALDAIESRRPFLGICIGMQLLFERSEESPNYQGLGVLSGEVRSLPENVRRPQMQWNAIHVRKNSQILKGLDGKWLYFVHSYAADLSPNNDMVAATCTYGNDVVAAVQSENVFATQFHPEKSSDAGKEFLVNFVNSCRRI
ncbi:MAG: imidazole glycerol phosphate synthase subunit HisH [Acidimicrobiaceae bacterium]|nr:imidazole glycerol phosphate synthase subunit HisH [Acidimicrobiaceae bacterium]HAY50998.1 imidazole glycerol phosphate synthase subunit HisH [Acidimicrobiaceae bacterium]|tara:strand:+ start:827 stop:1444 length:618 start_codon:yes stop_codon:yes gene_type:complete